MKAITRGRSRKEVIEDEGVKKIFREKTQELWESSVRTGMCTMLGLICWILYRRGWHKDKLNQLIDDVITALRMPTTPQGQLDNSMIVQYMADKGVDPMRIYDNVQCVVL